MTESELKRLREERKRLDKKVQAREKRNRLKAEIKKEKSKLFYHTKLGKLVKFIEKNV